MAEAHDHPRPQLVRSGWVSLDGQWDFAYDDANAGRRERWHERDDVFDRTITVPFPPESRASGIGDVEPHPYLWYRRTFTVDDPGDKRVLLHFGAVDYEATVWVNGSLATSHSGGHVPFFADITDLLRDGDEQVVVVRAEDQPNDLSQPRGKQVWGGTPRSILYSATSGIWQSVWLETVPRVSIYRLRWSPDASAGTLGLRVQLSQPVPSGWSVRVHLTFRGATLTRDVFSVSDNVVERSITLPTVFGEHQTSGLLWSPKEPRLIDAAVELLEGDIVVDTVTSYAGLRSVGIRKGRFLLNNRPIYLRMALEQGYWPESHLSATDAQLKQEVELAKALGFNALRVHQKVENPRFLYWCDRLGLMTWAEMPSSYIFTETMITRFTQEWMEALERDVSHPCVVAWVPTNESWGVPDLENDPRQRAFTRMLADLARALDGSRPVISNDGWEHVNSDILALHDYADAEEVLLERWKDAAAVANTIANVLPGKRRKIIEDGNNPEAPVMLTEVGGIGFPNDSDERWHFWSADTPEQLREKYAELIGAILASDTVVGFCYTQLTDTLQERNGLLDENRRPKVPIEEIYAITTGPSKSVPPR